MYWYPFSEKEEDKAWDQAQAQAKTSGTDGDAAKKFIGNLGEIAFKQYLATYSESDRWTYHNQNAIDNAQKEYKPTDFTIEHNNTTVDVKATADIRKFDPVAMYRTRDGRAPGHAKENYPKVNTDTADTFVFVQISHEPEISPYSGVYSMDNTEDSDELLNIQQRTIEERSGSRIAVIHGWLSGDEFEGEMVENMNDGAKGKFARLALNDIHELLKQTDALSE